MRFDAVDMRLDARTELWLSERLSDSDNDSDGNATGGNKCGLVDMRFDGAPSSTERSTECPSSVDSDTRGGGSCIVLPSLRSDGSGDALSTAVVPDADMDDAMDTRGERSFCEPIVDSCDGGIHGARR